MTAAAIVRRAAEEGVNLTLTPAGAIKAVGEGQAVARWLVILRKRKPDIVNFLSASSRQLNRVSLYSLPRCCLGCGGGDNRYDPLLPFGIEPTGHEWLHSRCWSVWYAARKAEVVAA